MWDPAVGREVRQQRAVPPVLQGVADQHLRRGQPRRRRAARRRWRSTDIVGAVRGLRARGVEFMPTPGSYYDMLPERLAARSASSSIDEDIDVLRELEILVDGEQAAQYLLQIFLKEAAGLLPRSGGRAVLLRDHPAQGRPGLRRRQLPRAVREHRARAAAQRGARRRQPMLRRAMRSVGDGPRRSTTSRCATRRASCATRSASRATASTGRTPSSITSDRPHTQRLAPADARLGAAASRRRPSRAARASATTGRRSSPRRGGPPIDARVPLLFNDDVVARRRCIPTRADPVYFSNGDGDDSSSSTRAAARCARRSATSRFAQSDYVFVPRGLLHRFLPDAGAAVLAVASSAPAGFDLPQQWRNEVGQLRMDAPYTPPRLPPPGVRGPARRGHARARGQARRRVPRLHATSTRRSTSSAGTAPSTRGRSRS